MILIDAIASEYGWPLAFITDELPLGQAFALFAAMHARYGNEFVGPTYAEREIADALTGDVK